jgi:shikimate kinase
MIISLVGMPGGGKSTVGRQMARQLGMRFVDTDTEIEARLGESIKSFFDRSGEAAFRDLESEVLAEVLTRAGEFVLATGGGIVLREANRDLLHRHSTVLYLRSTPEELFRRLRHDTQRPLLQVRDPLGKLRELYLQRNPLYRRCAHFVLETGRPSVHGLVNMALMQLELAGIVDPSRVAATVGAEPKAESPGEHGGDSKNEVASPPLTALKA